MLLEVSSLKKGFGAGSSRLEVLKGVDLSMKKGELVALMGPSGCGKSTLLNIIGGLLKGDSGSIKINADPPMKYGTKSPNQVIEVRRKGVGWIFQDFHLLDHITSLENVILSLELAGMSSEVAEQRAI